MRNNLGKRAALIMVFTLLLTPIIWLQGDTIALAAPSFKESKVEIIGEDETYQLDIADKVDKSTYKWSSTNTKVARVSSKGLVTSVGKGTATIRCIITYPSKKTKTIKSKVTVVIPATKVKINNAKEVNGAHILQLGESFNFNRDIVPAGSSDKTFWSIGGGDRECIEVTNTSSGIVKALKPGKVILIATAARTATEEDAENSIINDAIIIEVVGLSATVGSAQIIGSTEIRAVFDSPINEETVIKNDGTLLDSIAISLKKNIKGVMASDPGKLTAKLSADKKTLVITSSNRFEGEYGINFTNKIKTTDGIAINDYYKQLNYLDDVPPNVLEVGLDDSGMIASIIFTEAIDISNLKVTGGGLLPGSSTTAADPITVSILNNKNNYILSEDKKSLTINLSNISYSDFNKVLTVTMAGIKDMSGNTPANYTLPIFIQTDNTPKPQAKLGNVERTAYNTLTATFDRSIQFAGYASINNGSVMMGEIDEKNPNMVHYPISDSDAQRTGIQTVSISNWQGYNVDPKDSSSFMQNTRSVSFDTDKSSPHLVSYVFDAETSVLTLTYNKDITLSYNTGVFNSSLVTVTEDIISNNNITYTKMTSEDPKVVKLKMGNLTLLGSYTFTLDKYFARDSFRNYCIERSITINNSSNLNLELAGPHTITQSTKNPNQIFLEFATKLDLTSAQDVKNYTIPGVTIVNAKLDTNTRDGATVILTIADNSIDITLERPLLINGVTNFGATLSPITDYSKEILLKENKKPVYINPPVFDKDRANEIRLTFSEKIKGSMKVKVTQMSGSFSYEIGNTVTIFGTDVIISLDSMPINNEYLRIDILENNIVDLNDNQSAPMISQLGVVAKY